MDSALKVENLTKHYDRFSLNHVSFDLPKGSIMGFIGENGAGKTTTIKLILNLIKKDGGNVRVIGLSHTEQEIKIKERLGVVLDESSFHDNLKPADISRIMRNIYANWDHMAFLSYLQRLKLPYDKTVKEFSKGMKTKLSIAAALAHNPDLLILDEATSGLDPVIRNEILDIFLEFIQNEEHSVLISTHITSDLERIADYITLIHQGSIVFSKPKDDIVYNYGILKCGEEEFKKIARSDIIRYRKGRFGCEVLTGDIKSIRQKYANMVVDSASLEEIMLFYARGERI